MGGSHGRWASLWCEGAGGYVFLWRTFRVWYCPQPIGVFSPQRRILLPPDQGGCEGRELSDRLPVTLLEAQVRREAGLCSGCRTESSCSMPGLHPHLPMPMVSLSPALSGSLCRGWLPSHLPSPFPSLGEGHLTDGTDQVRDPGGVTNAPV